MKVPRHKMWHTLIRLGLIRIFYPCLMIFGTIGNILCLKILLRKRFRRQSTCQYLCILAVIDILFIYMRSTRYLYRYIFKVDLRNTSLWICRSFIFFSSTLAHLASWILVIVSFDRYLIIKYLFPYRHAGWRVIKSTFILIIIVCLVNAHYFYILGVNMKLRFPTVQTNKNGSNETYSAMRFVCIARLEFEQFFRYYLPIFDLFFVAIIPCLLMIFTHIGILRTTMRSSMVAITTRKQKRNNRLTIMLLSVTLAFLFLTCPSVIYICLNRLIPSTTFSDTKLVILDLFESLWYTKHAVNFILYTLSGQDFRREFRKLISCSKRSKSNTLRNQQQKEDNNLISMQSYVSSCRSSLINIGLHKSKKKQQYDTQNNLSKTLDSKAIHDTIIDDGNISIDGTFGLLTACSNIPSSTSFTSEQQKS